MPVDIRKAAIKRSSGPSTASRPPQIIDGRNVDPFKLSEVLDRKFGKGAYDVEMRHNKFLVRARAQLTQDEIQECSYC